MTDQVPQPVRWWWWAVWTLAAAVLWYAVAGGTWLLAELAVPILDGAFPSPLPLPLLPENLFRFAYAAVAGSVLAALLIPRTVPVVVGTVLASGVAAYLTAQVLRGSVENFWSDQRLLVPELAVLGLATVFGLAIGLHGRRRPAGWHPERVAVLLALVSPALVTPVLAGAADVVRMTGGGPYGPPSAVLAIGVVTLAAVAVAGTLLARQRTWGRLAVVAAYLVVVAFVESAVNYSLSQVRPGLPPRVDDLIEATVDVLPVVAAGAYTWNTVVALAVGAVIGVFLRRRAAPVEA